MRFIEMIERNGGTPAVLDYVCAGYESQTLAEYVVCEDPLRNTVAAGQMTALSGRELPARNWHETPDPDAPARDPDRC